MADAETALTTAVQAQATDLAAAAVHIDANAVMGAVSTPIGPVLARSIRPDCDGAGWHQQGKRLRVPNNITLVAAAPVFTRAQSDGEYLTGIIDVLVVTTGAGSSTGFPMAEGWDEVFRSNMAKVDPTAGQVTRRSDGKLHKPEGWQPPDLESILVARGIVEATPEEEPTKEKPVSDDLAEPGLIEESNDDATGSV